jgi:hypothetical protein
MRRVVLVLVLLGAAAGAGGGAAAWAPSAAAAAPGAEQARADFDDDGFVDLAVGIPDEDVEARNAAGAVVVLYGSEAGLTGARAQLFHQDLPQMVDRAEIGDAFGAALATGDLNGDGFVDLAVGVPGEDPGDAGSTRDAGAVVVLFGQAGGLTTVGDWIVSTGAERGDRYGSAVAIGSFDGVAGADLAVGVPGADVGAAADAGAVAVVPGASPGELGPRFVQGAGGVGGAAERGDGLGAALATADLDGDGRADLVAGAPGEDVGAAADAGGVVYLPNSAGGLTGAGSRVLAQGLGGLGGRAERGDRFGAVLEAGPANGDGPADLAVGAPGEAIGQAAASGAVSVLYGAAGGPSGAGDQLFFQGGGGLPDEPETGDGFGSALAVGQLDGDAFPDLAVGVPGEEYFANLDTGDVILLHGTAGGLSGAGSQSLLTLSNVGSTEADDHMGAALAARDFDDDGAGDLAVGIPGEDIDKLRDAGAIAYHQGPVGGPSSTESRPLHADSAGVPGASEPGDRFGSVLGPGPVGS